MLIRMVKDILPCANVRPLGNTFVIGDYLTKAIK